jgi:hypothetical protein
MSGTAARQQHRLTFGDLNDNQRSLVRLMHEHQFGRVENLAVRAGQPVINPNVKIVRVSKLGTLSLRPELAGSEDSELKAPMRELFDELDRLHNGTVVLLEFRHGLPFMLETTVHRMNTSSPTAP